MEMLEAQTTIFGISFGVGTDMPSHGPTRGDGEDLTRRIFGPGVAGAEKNRSTT